MATNRRVDDVTLYTRLAEARAMHIPPDTLKAWFVQASKEALERGEAFRDLADQLAEMERERDGLADEIQEMGYHDAE